MTNDRWNKRTREEIKEIVENLKYKLLDEYLDKNSNRKVIVQDEYGYKYDVRLKSLMIGQIPNFVGIRNQFTLSNISLWLKNENKSFILCDWNVFIGSREKLEFKCLKENCGEIFDTNWNDIYSDGNGCPFCSSHRVGSRNNLEYLYPDLMKEWDYDKNEKSPNKYSPRNNEKVFWICSNCGHSWDASMHNRTKDNGTGCPKCNHRKGERKIFDWLTKNWDKLKEIGFVNNIVPQKTFTDCINKRELPFDFGIESYKHGWTIIEFHGKQHYEPIEFFGGKKEFKKRKNNDKIKELYCINKNINLIVIGYWDFKNIENILNDYFFGQA